MTLPLFESYREIPLTQGQVALVDAEDYERINRHKWYAKAHHKGSIFYALRNVPVGEPGKLKQRSVSMHREVMGLEFGDPREVDHREQSKTLDNRRSNLRIATSSQNQGNQRRRKNASGYKGVYWYSQKQRWGARVTRNRETIFLGLHDSKEGAARAYDIGALRVFGEFAHTNFPRSDYPLVLTTTLPPD